ncbi:protein translocase subunit SecD [Dactylosporangium sucinum]|uniref:Multifunctional fusion protein n=1 Tax=Dactylosporangium sucinum TaxID=1424081 RepID=A0A917U101_9ACTN|nr:protein translocase subunit SecD [Dactylosporangium sucinum]GGM47864.1 protein translocase subunit SecDF [Dactylosporangium sucinum]
MSRALLVRAALVLVVLMLAGWLVATRPARLGLDLRGGTQIVLETRDGEHANATAKTTDEALEILRRRVDELGLTEPTLTRSGDRRIIVELPGVDDPQRAVEVIGRTAELTFRPVLGIDDGTATQDLVLPDEDGRARLRLGPAAVAGSQIEAARAVAGQLGGWNVNVTFRDAGVGAWAGLTGTAACSPAGDPRRRVAIVLDDQVILSPQVESTARCDVGYTDGRTTITGRFSAAEAKDLAVLIRAGALPVPVEVIEQRTVGPTLGRQAIEASAQAAVAGVAATVLFIVAVYRLAGGLAAVSLVAYGLVSYGALLALGATLTLPGLAGFVLAIGMAVDANVLVFERAREEYARGRPLGAAVRGGFSGAWSAIVDSNVTTLLAAGLLFFLASGPVRGFGVTLSVGVLASLFTALVLTRVLTDLTFRGSRPGRWSGIAHVGWVRRTLERRNPDLMGRRRRWLAISAIAVALAVSGIAVRGLNFGVEFTGGRLVQYTVSSQISVEQARTAVAAAGLPRAVVNEASGGALSVRAGGFDDAAEARVRAALAQSGAGTVERQRDERIGPSLGTELRRKAVVALAVALGAQLAYLALRFRWQWGAAAVLAMAHDVLVLIGVFAWLGKPVDGVFLAALLTVIGYSVNDSVVVFDRIRELVRAARGKRLPLAAVANTACLQTVPRTVNTGLGAVFVLTALALRGGDSLVDFATALLVGILVGTYSSVFLATPLAVGFSQGPRRPKRRR